MKAIVTVCIFIAIFTLSSCGLHRLDSEEFRNTAQKTEQYLFSISVKQAEIRDMLHSYNRSVPAERRLTLTLDPDRGLSDDALLVLKHHMEEEHDASCRGLLERVFELQEMITEHRAEVEELLADLPSPHRVRTGETHYGLSLKYLMHEHGLTRATADSIVSTAALSSDILEGFNIWFLYDDGVFSTLVTQGKAHISPAAFAKVVKKEILDNARAQGSVVEYETILDSLKRCGALLTCVKQASALGM